MIAILLALISAIAFGGSDYTAGLASRATSVNRVALAAQATSLVLSLLIVPWISPLRLTVAAAAWGAGSGLAGVFGAMMLYLGFRHAAFSVASTLSAVGSAALSVLAGLLLGERPGPLALTGIALAIPAIAAVSASPGADSAGADGPGAGTPEAATERVARGRHLKGVSYGLAAGAGFALYFIGLNRAGSGSGLWPVVVGEVVSVPVLAIVAAATGQLRLPPPGARAAAIATGGMGVVGAMTFFVASHKGLLAVTAVVTSLYPAGTIVLARILLGEKLNRIRLAGLCLAGASVALIAVAGVS
jgi:drug/metabolite transporter (DMT)-like permease